MPVIVTRNEKYQFGNKDRSRRVAQDSANNIKEDVFDVEYSGTYALNEANDAIETDTLVRTDAKVNASDSDTGAVTIDISDVARVFNNILSVQIISQDYANGFVSCRISEDRVTPDTIEFIHTETFGKPASYTNATPPVVTAATAPTYITSDARLENAKYTCVIRGY